MNRTPRAKSQVRVAGRARTRRGDQGLTLFEVMASLSLLTLTAVTVGAGLQTGSATAREVEENVLIQSQAQNWLSLIRTLQVGDPSDPDPSASQINDLFDGDTLPGTITLHQCTRWPSFDQGWVFTMGSFVPQGSWRVQVDYDANGDGLIGGTGLTTLDAVENESRGLRVSVFFNERPILSDILAGASAS